MKFLKKKASLSVLTVAILLITFTVAYAGTTGLTNLLVKGTLTVNGTTTLNGGVTVVGNTALGSNVVVGSKTFTPQSTTIGWVLKK